MIYMSLFSSAQLTRLNELNKDNKPIFLIAVRGKRKIGFLLE